LKGPIQSVEVTYMVHATEDPKKLEAAVTGMLGVDVGPETEELEGHFGNQISKVRFHLTGDVAVRAFGNAMEKLPPPVKRGVLADLGPHIDEHSALFLRFDKQALVSGSLSLASRDPVRMKVKPRIFLVKGGATHFFSQLIEGT